MTRYASMILRKRRYCRKHGHDLNQDPGDFVLHCLRCQAMVDMFDLISDADRAAHVDASEAAS